MLVAQLSAFPAAASSRVQGAQQEIRFSSPELEEHWDAELGMLVNTGPRTAWGGSVGVGAAEHARFSVKVRHRRWLGWLAAADVAAGIVRTGRRVPDPDLCCSKVVPGYGLTGDLAIGFVDWASLTARADLVWADGGDGAATAAYAGLSLGPAPSAAVTTGLAVLVLLFIASGPDF